MKTILAAAFAAIAILAARISAGEISNALSFPNQPIEIPALSLSESSRKVRPTLFKTPPPPAPNPRFHSSSFVLSPRTDVDYTLRVIPPHARFNYPMLMRETRPSPMPAKPLPRRSTPQY